MKKIIFGFLAIILVWFVVLKLQSDGNFGSLVRDDYKIGTVSTPTQLAPNGTATITLSTKNAKKVSANISMTASTTSSALTWIYSYSQDGTNFYSEDIDTVASAISITHGATSAVHSWTPATTANVKKRFEIKDINSNFVRIAFTNTVATSSIAVEGITEQETN